jgi:anti-sigma regulatory factor (Ser/Thr protein kinase)
MLSICIFLLSPNRLLTRFYLVKSEFAYYTCKYLKDNTAEIHRQNEIDTALRIACRYSFLPLRFATIIMGYCFFFVPSGRSLIHPHIDDSGKSETCTPTSMSPRSKLRIQSDVKNLAEIRRYVRTSAESLQVDEDVINEVVLAVDEAAANIILRGYQGQPGFIEIAVERQGDSLVIHLVDQAPVFDPTQVPPPDLTLPLEERPVGKLGVFLINQFMDDVIYSTPPEGGNHLILVKNYIYTENHEEESNDHND